MHLLTTSDPRLPMFFNVDASVGNRGQNSSAEDIYLVQLLIRKIAKADPSLRRHLRLVRMTGRIDEETIAGIRSVQKRMQNRNRRTIVDGRISRAGGLSYGGGMWTIASINAAVRQHYPNVWPRLQDFEDCPGPVAAKLKRIL